MPRSHRPAVIEFCESRTLLSATVASVLHPDYVRRSPAVTNDTVQGYTPAQIRAAYGFTGLTFANGTIAADGAGQTIAIVDAYNDPNIAADLKVFDTAFDLPAPPSFKIVSQTGGAHLPKTDSGWAGEIALDVEWAHAIAPAANILLVEADSDSTTDLLAAVNYARNAAGVSAVSMSWGGSEFVSSYNGGESNQQTTYDATFTTPLRHAGVTFVAAAGDTGQPTGAQWPATAPDVLSVGGTSLHLADDGTYQSETGWAGTSAGYSAVETEPAYQQTAQQSGLRSVSDVAYVGDPNTGVAVYDSLPADGSSGWATVGGTSAGAPQWAALVAIANQGRVVAGLTPLNGSSQTLPVLYSLYGTTGTAAHAGYVAAFNDVTSGGTGRGGGRRGGGGGSTSAVAGYDIVTGLGTPKAAAVVAALATGKSGTGVSDAPAPSATSLPIGLTLLSTPAAAVVGGDAGSLRYRLTNPTAIPFGGPVTIVLRASSRRHRRRRRHRRHHPHDPVRPPQRRRGQDGRRPLHLPRRRRHRRLPADRRCHRYRYRAAADDRRLAGRRDRRPDGRPVGRLRRRHGHGRPRPPRQGAGRPHQPRQRDRSRHRGRRPVQLDHRHRRRDSRQTDHVNQAAPRRHRQVGRRHAAPVIPDRPVPRLRRIGGRHRADDHADRRRPVGQRRRRADELSRLNGDDAPPAANRPARREGPFHETVSPYAPRRIRRLRLRGRTPVRPAWPRPDRP